jgi:hypothetical protein
LIQATFTPLANFGRQVALDASVALAASNIPESDPEPDSAAESDPEPDSAAESDPEPDSPGMPESFDESVEGELEQAPAVVTSTVRVAKRKQWFT